MEINHTELARHIHADNVAAGWWTDINTGESIIATRNRPEMLMLIVSELSEAHEAWVTGDRDDKLPQYEGFDVELADAAIRLYDLIGCEWGDRDERIDATVDYHREVAVLLLNPDQVGRSLMHIVDCVSNAMEGYRKGNTTLYLGSLFQALGYIWGFAYIDDIYLNEIIEAKRRFNATRADHKIENRKKVGGKAF